MRIAIVNDVALAVEALRRVIVAQGRDEVAWVARDGAEAVRRCALDRPDLLLLDLIMPHLDGVEATRQIMAKSPCAIVIVTASVGVHTAKVFEAMGAGALDAVNTPALVGGPDAAGPSALLAKIETIRRLLTPVVGSRGGTRGAAEAPAGWPSPVPLVCVGASAGGPAALAQLLRGLPADFPAAVVIVQHVDAQFAAGLAEWLRSHAPLPVRVAADGEVLQPGAVLLAGREEHLVLRSAQRVGYGGADHDSTFRPSVDAFFRSVARHRGVAGAAASGRAGPVALRRPAGTIGVLLTGMGRDGAAGLLAMRERGLLTLAQDESSSAVFGMPKAAVELGAAVEIVRLDLIAARLIREFAAESVKSKT